MDGRRIDVRQVKANVVKLLADNPQGSVVIQADEKAMADTIIKVMDGSREAGVYNISLASEPKQRIILNTANNSINTLYQTLSSNFLPDLFIPIVGLCKWCENVGIQRAEEMGPS